MQHETTPNDNQVALPELPEWNGEFMTESEFAEAAQAYALEAVRMNQPTAGEAVARDREADRVRFADAAFNNWLDEGISDSGHTVWDAVGDVSTAWSAWCAREFYGMPPVADCVAPEEIYIRDGAGRYVLCDLQETTFDDLPLYCARTQVLYTTPPAAQVQCEDFVHHEYTRGYSDAVKAAQVQQEAVSLIDALDLSNLCHATGTPEWPLNCECPKHATHPAADALGAVRELVAKWRAMAPLCKTPGYGEAMRENADVLEATLAQAPAVRVDDVLLRVSDEDLRWCKDIVGAMQEAGGPTNNMRAVGLSRLIAALEAALGQGKANG